MAVNCWVSPRATEGLAGVTATDFNAGAATAVDTATMATADFVLSATEVHVRVTVGGLGIFEGAV